jgi:hypothetical protein
VAHGFGGGEPLVDGKQAVDAKPDEEDSSQIRDEWGTQILDMGHPPGDILTAMPPSADPEKSKFEKGVSVVKDLASIVALGSAAVWFCMQKPFTPVIKGHADVAWIKHGDHFEVNALTTFENTGHVPFKYACVAFDHYPFKKIAIPAPICGANKGTIFPGGTKSDGLNFEVPVSDPERAFLVVAVIGNVNRDNSWAKDAVRIFQPVNLKDDDGNKK